jgi:hypothetical protein
MAFDRADHPLFQRDEGEMFAAQDFGGTQVAGDDDVEAGEIQGVARGERHPVGLGHGQEQVDELRVGLFDFIEEPDPAGGLPIGLLEPAWVAGPVPEQIADPVQRLELGAIEADEVVGTEDEIGEVLGGFRFPHAGGPGETGNNERTRPEAPRRVRVAGRPG